MKTQYDISTPRKQSGLSLVELMVAMTLSLILLGGVIQIFIGNKNAFTLTRDISDMQENGRLAVSFISESIRQADHWGGMAGEDLTMVSAFNNDMGSCAANEVTATDSAIIAFEGDATGPSFCDIDTDPFYADNSDVLVLRYANGHSITEDATYDASNVLTNPGSVGDNANLNKVYVRIKVGQQGTMFFGNNHDLASVAIPGGDDVRNYDYAMDVYYVRQCAIVRPDGTCADTTPTLMRMSLQDNQMALQPLVEGIEQVQYEMGVDTDGDLAPDTYQTITDVADWDNVITVRMSVLSRASQADGELQGLAASPIFAMAGGFNYQNPDRQFRLRQYDREVHIRNRTRANDNL